MLAVSGIVAVAGLVAAAFLVDRALHDGRVVRNVTLDGDPIGGVALADLSARLADDAASYGAQPLTIDLGDAAIESTAAEFGYVLDSDATVAAVASAGREGGIWDQLLDWLGRIRDPEVVETRFSSSEVAARDALLAVAAGLVTQPIEPAIGHDGRELWVDTGSAGRRLDVEATLEAVQAATTLSDIPGTWEPLPSAVSPGDAVATFTALKGRIEDGIVIHADTAQSFISPRVAGSWISGEVVDEELIVSFDAGEIARVVEEAFFGYVSGELFVTYDVVAGVPIVSDIADGRRVCCEPEVVDRLVDVLAGAGEPIVEVPLRQATPDEQAAAIRDLGVAQEVATFTTRHNCCESRVTNIQLIADLINGVVMYPGDSFSINEFVGERTREKGFVDGGVIYQGEFESDIGGGISQYATTLFNAAFFAGLEFEQYQSHSLYLSRYPYGREATVSYPEPDLIIHNQTPYAVLIWSSYGPRSITVTLYSTPMYEVEQSGQLIDRAAACTRVTTYRTRTDADGTVLEDAVYAFYRPTAGYDCGDLELEESDEP